MKRFILPALFILIVVLFALLAGRIEEPLLKWIQGESVSTYEIGESTSLIRVPQMVFVEGGLFTMGCSTEQYDCQENELPAHQVMVSDFYMGKYEVTVAEFEAFIAATGYQTDAEREGFSYVYIDDEEKRYGINWRHNAAEKLWDDSVKYLYAVLNVSWNDATAYCNWLSEVSGKDFRLPTEAEWEYAARGGNKSKGYVFSGSHNIEKVGWYRHDKFSEKESHKIGQKHPNELGLYDMTGNLWEWCNDIYGKDYYKNSPSKNPKGPSESDIEVELRVIRGGGWCTNAKACRVSVREMDIPSFRCGYGFRIVMEP
jgi:formylglycine-generating enzyme required for sulfatase activity